MTSADYYSQVIDIADTLNDPEKLAEEYGEDRDKFEVLDEIVDGHEFVIYNFKAMKVLEYSDNTDAYFDEMGAYTMEDGFFSSLPPLAYFAMRQDIVDRLD